MEFVRKMLVVEHAAQIKDGENIGTQDYVDMEVCAYAGFEADVFLGETKWVDHGIIEVVFDRHPVRDPPVTVSSHDEFLEVVREGV